MGNRKPANKPRLINIRLAHIPRPSRSKIKIAPLIRLQNMAGIQPSIPAPIPPPDRHRPPSRPPPRHLLLRHQQIQPPTGDINPNLIPIMHQRQRPAHRRLRRDMQNTGPIRSPAHPCIRQPQQITNTHRQQLLRNRQAAPTPASPAPPPARPPSTPKPNWRQPPIQANQYAVSNPPSRQKQPPARHADANASPPPKF